MCGSPLLPLLPGNIENQTENQRDNEKKGMIYAKFLLSPNLSPLKWEEEEWNTFISQINTPKKQNKMINILINICYIKY